MRNLLDNAVKFSPQGGEVVVRVAMSGPAHVAIEVHDHGVGVPADERPGLFQRYQHTPGSSGGLGLGLYVSRQIVERHGGRIEAEFPEDGGTRLVVTLPIAMSAPEAVAAAE